jgi:hypothetical protein
MTLAITIAWFVWVSPLRAQVPSLGATWTEATNAAPWGGRSNFGAVAFNGQMWVLGGYDGTNWLNDVWSSGDGSTWTQATSASWAPRVGHRAVVFNGRIWVLGGHNGAGSLDDVWSSSDGVTWTQATSAAPWSQRYNFGATVLNGQMWVLGGYDGSSRNDVWSSSDGMTWTQATNAAPWSARYHLGAVTLNGQMWVLGGYDGSLRNDVWSSSDGVTWTQVTNAAPWSARWTHRALTLNGQMWVLGGDLCSGSLSSGCYTNDVWSSSDGVNWTPATHAAAWSGRGQFGAEALNGQMWVLGGGSGNSYFKDVWLSGNATITCPDNIVTNISGCSATVTYPPATAESACGEISTNYCSPASGSSFSAGVNTVTCTATDIKGNTVTSSFTITVLESTPPTISCPDDITTDTDLPCGTTKVVTFAPTESDNCSGLTVSCSPASGSAFPEGTNTVNCTARDASGNTTGCSFNVIVRNHLLTPTTMSCPADIVTNITPHCTAVVTYAPTVTSGCGVTLKSVTCRPVSGSTFKTGTTPVTCTAIDSGFHTNTCSFNVTVLNTAPGEISYTYAPTNFLVSTCLPMAYRWKQVVADGCLSADTRVIVTNYCVPPSGTVFDMGTTTVNCYTADKSGNSASCSFVVTMADITRPRMKIGVKNECVIEACDGSVSYSPAVGATDTCSAVNVVCVPPSGANAGSFTISGVASSNLVTCTATDAGGNHTNSSWNVLVNRRVKVEWVAPLGGDNLCFVDDSSASPANTINAGVVLVNKVKLFDLNDNDVTAEYQLGVVTIAFDLRNQDTPSSSSLIRTVVPVVPKAAKNTPAYIGKSGTALKPFGTMVYQAGGQYFEVDCSTYTTNAVAGAAWIAGTTTNSNFYRATVTVTPPKPFCTKSVVGTGAVRFETNP